jgi:hypothetical protein
MFSGQLMRRSRRIVKPLSILLAATVLAFDVSAVYPQAIADGTYIITNACNGKMLGLESDNPNPGGNVVLRDAGSVGAIDWQVSATADGSAILRAANTQSALQTSYEQTQNETNVDLWTYWGSPSQRWIIGDGGNGTFKLSFAAAPVMALDAKYGGANGETEVWLYAANDTCAQRWKMQRVDDVVRNDLNAGATFTVTQSGRGKVIYIVPNGNDSNSGLSKSQAMATLTAAQTRAAAGDTIELAGGTYPWAAGTYITASGSPDDWIVIRAEEINGQAATVVIQGDYRWDTPSGTSCITSTSTYLEIKNLTCDNFSNNGFESWGSHHLSLIGNTFRSLGNTGIGLYSDRDKNRKAFEIRVENNVVSNTNRRWYERYADAGWGQGISMFGDTMTARNNRVLQTRGEAIGVAGVGNWVAGNTIIDPCAAGVYLDTASYALIEQNFIASGRDAGSITFLKTCQRTKFDNGVPLTAIGIQIAAEQASYTNDVVERLVGNVIRNNIAVNGRTGLLYGNYSDGNGGDGMRNTQIINNTFIGSTRSVFEIFKGGRSGHSNNIIANNIFYWTAPNPPAAWQEQPGGISFSNNLWSGVDPGPVAGAAGVFADPKFKDANGQSPDDFRIGLNSPASASGNNAYRPQVDFFGSNRGVKSSLDIGAILAR